MYLDKLREKAKSLQKKIVLPEGADKRTIIASEILARGNLVGEVVLLGNVDNMKKTAQEENVSLDGVTLLDPLKLENHEQYVNILYENRKHKNISKDDAARLLDRNPLYAGAAMVAAGRVDGMVAGSINPTAVTIRSALFLVGLDEDNKTLSSFFVMLHPDSSMFGDGVFIYADCGVVPNPTAEQLADIACATAKSYRSLVDENPHVALLSFSTKGSGSDPIVDKVVQAKEILDSRNVDFVYDGEVQFDAAIIPEIAKRKAPDSPLGGEANVFIFPDLNAGNICYKVTERVAKCTALGPLLQGIKKPINDLSRGCSAQDIADISVITALQA